MPAPSFPDDSIPEPRLVLPSLTTSIAFELGAGIRTHFLERYAERIARSEGGIVIQIKLFSGHTLFACAVGEGPTPGPDNWTWADRKERVVKATGMSTWGMKVRLEAAGRAPADAGLIFPEYAVAGGGVPLWVKGNTTGPVGSVIVSGLPQREDHQLIMNAVFGTMAHLVEPPVDARYITV